MTDVTRTDDTSSENGKKVTPGVDTALPTDADVKPLKLIKGENQPAEEFKRPSVLQIQETWRKAIDREDPVLGTWLYHEFGVYVENDQDHRTPVIVDSVNKTIRRVNKGMIVNCLLQVSSEYCNSSPIPQINSYGLTPTLAIQVCEFWLACTPHVFDKENTKAVAFKSDPQWTFKRIDFDPMENIDDELFAIGCKNWAEVASRMSNFKAFCAFVWSLFADEAGERRQYVWLYGVGQSGKSQIADTIATLLSGAVTTANPRVCVQNNWTFSLLGKKLCILPEADAAFPTTSMFKSVTGDSKHRVNEKYMVPFDAEIETRFVFISNDELEITSDRAAMSRAILCHLDGFEGKRKSPRAYCESLMMEMSCFLGYCKRQYGELTNEEGYITADVKELNELAQETEQDFHDLFDDKFEVSVDGYCLARDVRQLCKDRNITDRQYVAFKHWLKRTYGAENKGKKIAGKNHKCFVGIAIRDRYIVQSQDLDSEK